MDRRAPQELHAPNTSPEVLRDGSVPVWPCRNPQPWDVSLRWAGKAWTRKSGRRNKELPGACDQADVETKSSFFLPLGTSRGASGLSSISALHVSPACRYFLKPWCLGHLPTPPEQGTQQSAKATECSPASLAAVRPSHQSAFCDIYMGGSVSLDGDSQRARTLLQLCSPYALRPVLSHSRCTVNICWNQSVVVEVWECEIIVCWVFES